MGSVITENTLVSEDLLRGQAEIWGHMFSFTDSMALKCAVELSIADVIHSHSQPITLSQIASSINSPSPDIPCLGRIMRFLVRKKIFTVHPPSSDGKESLYGPTEMSKWLLRDSDHSLAPIILFQNHPWAIGPWHYLSTCVKEGGIAFKKAHDHEIWDFASRNPEFNDLFNDAMACTARIITKGILTGYKDGFDRIGSLVDVGGGTGDMVAEIVKSHPHIKATNFDLPHVIATAPSRDGVSHVGGDMFLEIPNADAVLMKWILHDWTDEDCVRILKNCKKAIPEKSGKVIIVEAVLKEEGNGRFDEIGMVFDLVMIAHTSGGKERTDVEWKRLLEEGGFPRSNIISVPALLSIIEAYVE